MLKQRARSSSQTFDKIMKPFHKYYSIILFSMCASGAHAHMDTFLYCEGPNIIGLPPKYQPAYLDIDESRLRVGNHEMEFTPYLKQFFPEQPCYLDIRASWYHRKTIGGLPPYMSIRISSNTNRFHHLLFDMNTLEVIKIRENHFDQDLPSFDWSPSELQAKAINASIKLNVRAYDIIRLVTLSILTALISTVVFFTGKKYAGTLNKSNQSSEHTSQPPSEVPER